jgi:hypothetical protein
MMSTQRLLFGFIAISFTLMCDLVMAAEEVGFYTAVAGQVSVTHPGDTRLIPVKLHDQVLFKDVIETQRASRTKAFFQDDSILTVGENSRVEIDEYIYQPDNNVRRAVVRLLEGQVRALVSKVFKANGSRFEVHTPSAIAAARGTYFTVWVHDGQSGIINIGETGRVDFTSGGATVTVDPGYYSVAKDGDAPSVPARHYLGQEDRQGVTAKSTDQKKSAVRVRDRGAFTGSFGEDLERTKHSERTEINLGEALAAVDRTGLRDELFIELPTQAIQALNVDVRLLQALTTLTGGSTVTPGVNGETASVAAGSLRIGVTTASTSGGSIPTATLSVGSTTLSTTPVTSSVTGAVTSVVSAAAPAVTPLVSTVVAPVVSVTAPVVPLISTVTAPIAPVISTVTAPVAPVTSSVVAPVAPIINTIIATPPAVINGALSR